LNFDLVRLFGYVGYVGLAIFILLGYFRIEFFCHTKWICILLCSIVTLTKPMASYTVFRPTKVPLGIKTIFVVVNGDQSGDSPHRQVVEFPFQLVGFAFSKSHQ
jgi:hypothetical protein